MTATRELVGNAARDEDLAWVRLTVAGQRIEHAAGEGLGLAELLREVEGRTLLDAASVPGERLAADALHDALGPVVSAAPDEGRVAVAMSGGVDSAVALLRVRDAGHEPVGVTLRLWTDPAGKDSERVCCSPASVVAAREACQALGFPHITLDLREPFRRAVVDPFVRGYARGETPNPCVRCNGGFRFGALLAFAKRIGASRLATGHYARIAEHRDRVLLARGADPDKDQSYMLAEREPEAGQHARVHAGEHVRLVLVRIRSAGEEEAVAVLGDTGVMARGQPGGSDSLREGEQRTHGFGVSPRA